jgi:hypothetical protein
MAKRLTKNTITWALSGTDSTSVQLTPGRIPLAIQFPSAFTGTSVAVHGSHDGTTYAPIYNAAGTAYTLAVDTAAARYIPLDRTLMDSVQYVRFVGSSQAAARTAYLISGE